MLDLKGTVPVRTSCWAVGSQIFPPPYVNLCSNMVASLHSSAVPLRAGVPKFGICPACAVCANVPAPASCPWTCAPGTWAQRKARRDTSIVSAPACLARDLSLASALDPQSPSCQDYSAQRSKPDHVSSRGRELLGELPSLSFWTPTVCGGRT